MINDHLPQRELEMLSAYLDGELSPRQLREFEARLDSDTGLRNTLSELQAVARSLQSLPAVKPPRSFVLTPEMAGLTDSRAGYPALRLATALAAVAFVLLVGLDVLTGTMSGAIPARMLEQAAVEAPAAAELELAGAAKSEVSAAEAEMEAPLADQPALEATAEEQPAEALAAAAPAAEGEAAGEERALGEADAQLVTPELVEPSLDEALPDEPGTMEAAEGEAQFAFSATEVTAGDAMTNLVEPAQPVTGETFADDERGSTPSIPWIRVAEAGLALFTLVLGALAFWARSHSK